MKLLLASALGAVAGMVIPEGPQWQMVVPLVCAIAAVALAVEAGRERA